jgi:ElaB/YqjD/DUF883 family membrane-anchored ribosome-binding protein
MTSQQRAQVTPGNFTPDALTQKSRVLKDAASDWAGSLKEGARSKLMESGAKTETYIRDHPGRFIAGACCLGFAAGLLLGYGKKTHKK